MAFAHARPPAVVAQYSPLVVARAGRVSAPDPASVTSSDAVSLAFPREARLLDGAAFSVVFKKNRRLTDRYWTLLCHDAGTEGSRLGLAIAKKRARRAHDRNRIKRVARESFRHHRAVLANRHIVLMNRDAAATATPAELRLALDRLWALLLAGKARQ